VTKTRSRLPWCSRSHRSWNRLSRFEFARIPLLLKCQTLQT